ncbi:MAG: acetylxylan esterase [Planctomycetia bacterium]|nr:acetylxylan esterase [Planctomycetia bacterium]
MSHVLRRLGLAVFFACGFVAASHVPVGAADKPASDAKSATPPDARLGPLKDLDGYFPFTVPTSTETWQKRADFVRKQVAVSQGIWPMPTKTPLNAVVNPPLDRDGYTVSGVFFESVPGHYVCGSLYRPKGFTGKRPVVLCPHGHWKDARFHDAGEAVVSQQIKTGAEKYQNAGRFFLQSKCAHLAKLGCIVFIYDMEGYSDATQLSFDLGHRYGTKRPEMETPENWGLYSPQAESRLQSLMGLQTWNSVRVLDFLTGLDDVDATRIGVTGASGGGTQTFLLAAVDPRPTVIVPAVMVSTAMQGGCTCENSCLLRVETGNIELAGVFAPRPMAVIAANDWTREIMTKGYPELKGLYKLTGAEANFEAFPYIQFPHNYNYVSRAAMYGFFNKHLKLEAKEPIVEGDIEPLTVEQLTVWSKEHPKPAGGDAHERDLLRKLTADSDQQIAALTPKDAASLAKYREVVGGAVDVIIGRRLSDIGKIDQENLLEEDRGDYLEYRCLLSDKARGETVVASYYYPKKWNKQVVVWADGKGTAGLTEKDGKASVMVETLVALGYAVAGLDPLGIGEHTNSDFPANANRRVKNPRMFAGFTYGYNHPLFAQRVHDILAVVAHARAHSEAPTGIHLIGTNGAGPWVAAALAQCDAGTIDFAEIETGGFRFDKLTDYLDANFLPGIVKYGDLPALIALGSPKKLIVRGEAKIPELVHAARAAGTLEAATVGTGKAPALKEAK